MDEERGGTSLIVTIPTDETILAFSTSSICRLPGAFAGMMQFPVCREMSYSSIGPFVAGSIFLTTKLQVRYPQKLQREFMPDQSQPPSETPCKPAASDTLLIVEDDAVFADRLAKSLEDKGYLVRSASSISAAIDCVSDEPPAYAIIDMRLPDGNGLDFVSALKKGSPDCRAVILTGYGNIPSAVVAVEAGAFDFLAKPADADEIHNALRTARHDEVLIPFTPASSDHVRRKHIDAVFEEYGQNVSETARRLSMHRRTLQRILGKNVPR